MSKQDERAQKAAQWLEHLQGWKESGGAMAAYAKGHGLALWAMYHWRQVLIREGHWHEQPNTPRCSDDTRRDSPVPIRFARVAVTDSPLPLPLIVRVHLCNGRRAEIELGELNQLDEVLGVLERRA
ncbi:MAG TPA: hypothetical protein VGN07_11035 [Steroidobacteraceae bacterium]|jgi:hypothetical protein